MRLISMKNKCASVHAHPDASQVSAILLFNTP